MSKSDRFEHVRDLFVDRGDALVTRRFANGDVVAMLAFAGDTVVVGYKIADFASRKRHFIDMNKKYRACKVRGNVLFCKMTRQQYIDDCIFL